MIIPIYDCKNCGEEVEGEVDICKACLDRGFEIKECTIDDLRRMDPYTRSIYLQKRHEWLKQTRSEYKEVVDKHYRKIHNFVNRDKLNAQRRKWSDKNKERLRKYYHAKNAEIRNDPVKYKESLERQRIYNNKKMDALRADPIKYQTFLEQQRVRYREYYRLKKLKEEKK